MALRIIDLDIDEALTADTRVAEVGWVLQPAIETEFVYFNKTNLTDAEYKKVKDVVQKLQQKLEYEPTLPEYVNYATGKTEDDMLIKPVLFVERQPGETKDDYISRCVEYHIKNEGMEADQAYAICISATEEFYKGEKVSFDYDDTLSTARGYGLALHEKFLGAQLYIISARRDKQPMLKVADKLGIPHDRVFATGSNQAKIQKIKELNINRHFDNNKEVIKDLGNKGVQFSCPCLDEMVELGNQINDMVEMFGLIGLIDGEPVFTSPQDAEKYGQELGCSGYSKYGEEGYVACSVDEVFESYNDYPEAASNNACRVLKWIDEKGRDEVEGMTETGLARANQLCNRENISEETIARMAAFERHRENSNIAPEFEGTPWKDKGYVAWLGWGGDAGVEWASRKLEQIRKNEELSYDFSVEEYTEEDIEAIKALKFLAETDYEKFEAVVGSMRGATEQEIFRRGHKKPVFYFKYERVLSGSPDRDFCMSIENRFFRRFEIDLLQDTNREFGHKGQSYSKWLYKGGPNCVHAWNRFVFTPKDKRSEAQLKELGLVSGTAGTPPKNLPNNGYYSPETKRKSEVAYIVSQQNMSKQIFKADDEQRMIYTPLMLPNVLIPRNDGDGDIYFVRFRPEVIEKIRNKFMIEGRLRATNYEHSDQKFNDIVMVESWIVNTPNDKVYDLGFTEKQVPIGSWIGGYKVLETPEGDIIWNDYIKSGKVKGASVEGEFLLKFYKETFSKDDILLEQIIGILQQVVI